MMLRRQLGTTGAGEGTKEAASSSPGSAVTGRQLISHGGRVTTVSSAGGGIMMKSGNAIGTDTGPTSHHAPSGSGAAAAAGSPSKSSAATMNTTAANNGVATKMNVSSQSAGSSAAAREKAPPFSPTEIKCMMDACRKHRDVLTTRSMSMAVNSAKRRAWLQITKAVNSAVPGRNRTVVQVRKKWKELVIRARKDYRKFRSAAARDQEHYPELGMYSESIWDIYGSHLDGGSDSEHSSKQPGLAEETRDNDRYSAGDYSSYGMQYGDEDVVVNGSAESDSADEGAMMPMRKRMKASEDRYYDRPVAMGSDEETSEDDGRYLLRPEDVSSLDGDTAEDLRNMRWSLLKAKLAKIDLEKKKLEKEIKKLDADKAQLLLQRQKTELEIMVLRQKLGDDGGE